MRPATTAAHLCAAGARQAAQLISMRRSRIRPAISTRLQALPACMLRAARSTHYLTCRFCTVSSPDRLLEPHVDAAHHRSRSRRSLARRLRSTSSQTTRSRASRSASRRRRASRRRSSASFSVASRCRTTRRRASTTLRGARPAARVCPLTLWHTLWHTAHALMRHSPRNHHVPHARRARRCQQHAFRPLTRLPHRPPLRSGSVLHLVLALRGGC